MIVNVRGANGSGKSTCVRRVLDLHETREEIRVDGRARPLGYSCTSLRPGCEKLLIPGAYETPTGGCDTISSADLIYSMVLESARGGADVLFEGIVAQHNTTRLLEIHREIPVLVIRLATTEDECVEGVRQRRAARGDDREFDPKNVRKEYRSVLSSERRLLNNGVTVHVLSREDAFETCAALLRGETVLPCAE